MIKTSPNTKPLIIGNLSFEHPVFLAPMAGYTNLPFRLLCKEFGAAAVFTEMVSAKGLYYRDKKTASIMATAPEEAPAGVQIFGSDPGILEEVTEKYINPLPFAIVDFNAGCPAPKIVKNGDGSALLKNLPLLKECVRRIKNVSAKPVTVKMRIGWDADHINALEAAEALEAAGADALIVHGRTREAFYSGKADRQTIAAVKKHAGIPIIANGDITDADSARQIIETTGCDGIMVGRGAVGNPFIFEEIIQSVFLGRDHAPPTPAERIAAAIKHIALLDRIDTPGRYKEMRKHLVCYTKGMRNATALRNLIFQTNTKEEMVALLSDYLTDNDENAASAWA